MLGNIQTVILIIIRADAEIDDQAVSPESIADGSVGAATGDAG